MSDTNDEVQRLKEEHERLNEEWERLDKMGSQDIEQQRIASAMERIRNRVKDLTGAEM